jgi:hypothetical protein
MELSILGVLLWSWIVYREIQMESRLLGSYDMFILSRKERKARK